MGAVDGKALRIWPDADKPHDVVPLNVRGVRAVIQGLNAAALGFERALNEAVEIIEPLAEADPSSRAAAWMNTYGEFARKD